MYKLIFSLLFVGFIFSNVNAQNKKGKSDDLGRIVLNSYIAPQAEAIPSHAKRMLLNKLSQITSANGMGGSSLNPRFILTPNITVLTKDKELNINWPIDGDPIISTKDRELPSFADLGK